MNLIKKLFCKHDYTFEGSERKSYKLDDPSEPCYIIKHVTLDKYRCKKCGKRKIIYTYLL